jgi:hypothetical protein
MKAKVIVFQDYQRFDLIEVKPYIRKQDGKRTKLLIFESSCAACNRLFTNTTMMMMLDNSRPLNRRCKRCLRKEAKLFCLDG